MPNNTTTQKTKGNSNLSQPNEPSLNWPTENITTKALKPLFSVRSSPAKTSSGAKPKTAPGSFDQKGKGQIRVFVNQAKVDDFHKAMPCLSFSRHDAERSKSPFARYTAQSNRVRGSISRKSQRSYIKPRMEDSEVEEALKHGNVILPAPIKVSAKNNSTPTIPSIKVNNPTTNSLELPVQINPTSRTASVIRLPSSASTERDVTLSTKDYLSAHSFYNRPKEVQPYCHVPKGRAGQLMGWRKAQKESLAWEAEWDPPIIHHTLLSQIQSRKLYGNHRPHTHQGLLHIHTPSKDHLLKTNKQKTKSLKSKDSTDCALPSISESTQPYVYPERQEISLLDEGFIRSLLTSREGGTAKPRTSPSRLMTASKPSIQPLPVPKSPAAALSEAIRAFVVAGTASKEVQDSSNDLDLHLQIIELFLKEKSLFQELEHILKREDVKDTRARRLRRKQVIRVFRRLHERVVKLVESQPAEEVSKARQAHMDRFLEASRRNLIFLKNVGAYDPWPEMQAELNLLTSVVPQLITI